MRHAFQRYESIETTLSIVAYNTLYDGLFNSIGIDLYSFIVYL